MRKLTAVTFSVFAFSVLFVSNAATELRPVVGLSIFGGAERGNAEGVSGPAGAIGGTEIFGLFPFTEKFGLQGGLLNQGGRGAYRLGVSAGPVFDYSSGKVGLFTDYVYQGRRDNDFFYLRGQWSHYFQNFDLILSYSQPVYSRVTDTRLLTDPGGTCGIPDPLLQSRTRSGSGAPAYNEFKSSVRMYPTQQTEVTLGFLANSFAGPDRNKTGTGFGGVFGASIQILDWLVFRAIQGQMDTRERYRITSGVEFIWTPQKTDKPDRLIGQERDTDFALASTGIASAATFGSFG